jgi:zinc transport system permease protein
VIFAIIIGILVLEVRKRTRLSFDTVLGVLFASVAGFGLFLLTFLENVRIDLFGLLFGDILALSNNDVWLIACAGALSLVVLWSIHRELILEIVHPDLALAEGVSVRRNDLIFGIVVATMIALGIKLIGIILLSGLFLIPSATSYLLARSFRELVWGAVITGVVASIGGVVISASINTATGPTIVLAASTLFAIGFILRPYLNPQT